MGSTDGADFRNAVLLALSEFDAEHLDTNEYRNWLENKSFHWAIVHNEKLYPPKRIAEMAAGRPMHSHEAFPMLNSAGFKVEPKPRQ